MSTRDTFRAHTCNASGEVAQAEAVRHSLHELAATRDRQQTPAWLVRLSPHGRQMIARVLAHFGAPLAGLGGTQLEGIQQASPAQVTRQARHAKQARARTTAVAGALLLAPLDQEIRSFTLSAEFARLRPYSAEIQSKSRYLLPFVPGLSLAGIERVFDAGADLFLSLGPRVTELDDAEVLRIYNAVAALLLGPLLCPAEFRGRVADLVRDARRAGLDRNMVLRLRLTYLQSWVGEETELQQLVLDPSVNRTRLADGYLFVRSDSREEQFSAAAEFLRAGAIDPERCLSSTHPEGTIAQLLDFTMTRLRDTPQLRTAGYLLLLLTAVEHAREHAHELHARGVLRDGLAAVNERLTRFERVQVMEKRRYYELLESMPDGPAKRRLNQLWRFDFAAYAP